MRTICVSGQHRQRIFKKTFAALGGRLPETRVDTANPRRRFISRIPVALAGKFRRLKFRFDNAQFDGNGALYLMPTSLTILGAGLEINGVTVPIKFNGELTRTLSAGELRVWSDFVRPSEADLSRFQTALHSTTAHGYRKYQGQRVYLRVCGETPNFTGEIPIGCIAVDADGEALFALYDPANHIDQVYGTGTMTVPSDALVATDFPAVGNASAPNNMGFGPSEIIGETFDTRQLVTLVRGPSTPSGREDDRSPTDMNIGWGFIDRAMQSEDGSLDYVIPCGHMTRTGGDAARMGANEMTFTSYDLANHLIDWLGNNGIANGYTAGQEVNENLPVILNRAKQAGIDYTMGFLGSPRTTSTDDYETYANQSYSSSSYGPGGMADYLMRRMARAGALGNIDLVMALPQIRSQYDPWKWFTDGVTANLMTADGLHEPKYGHEVLAEQVRWGLDTGLAMPRVSRNFAAACLIKPTAITLNKIEAFMAAANAAGVTMHMAHWLNAPILDASDDGYQTRRVNMVWPGVWNLHQNDTGGTITYGANGTKSDGTAFLGAFLTPSLDFSPGNAADLSPVTVDSISIAFKCNDESDTKPVVGTPSGSGSDRTLYVNPKDGSGNFGMRLNDTTNFSKACSSAIGTFVGSRSGTTREAWRNGTSLGTDTVATTNFSTDRLRLFASIATGDITTKELSFFCISHAWDAAQVAAMTTAIDTLTA
jgi:hypothetical protein